MTRGDATRGDATRGDATRGDRGTRGERASRVRLGAFLLGGLVVALLLAGIVSNFASGSPDGLDSAARRGCTADESGGITGGTCMAQSQQEHELGDSPLAEYGIRGIENGFLSTGLAGVAGVLLTFAIGAGLFWVVRRRQPGGQG